MSDQENAKRESDLNARCERCQRDLQKKRVILNPQKCDYCPVGRELHELECKRNSGWENIDWNSSKWEHLYRH